MTLRTLLITLLLGVSLPLGAVPTAEAEEANRPVPAIDSLDPLALLRARLEDLSGRLDDEGFSEEALLLYLEVFEPLEPGLMAEDPSWTRKAEGAFHDLLQAAPSVRAKRLSALLALLAVERIAPGSHLPPQGTLFASAMIILREGLEVLLIIAVLIGFLRRSGRESLLPSLWGGMGLALLATGGLALWARDALSAADAEVLEGATMLLASVVLLGVSLWFWGKSARGKWEEEISARVDAAAAKGSRWAMGGIGFLTVFREGFETVLFYRALIAFSRAPSLVWWGFLIGVGLLSLAGLFIVKASSALPIGPLFRYTGLLLFIMSFAFAGQGVSELQEGGLLSITPLEGMPTWRTMGINPSLEALLAQSAVLGLGFWWLLLGRRRRVGVE